jgi:hypothetical protein
MIQNIDIVNILLMLCINTEWLPGRVLLLREIQLFAQGTRTVGTRARASCAPVAGGQSGSESAARCRPSSLIASKARQSLLRGRFGLSLNFAILPLFIRLGPLADIRICSAWDAIRTGPHLPTVAHPDFSPFILHQLRDIPWNWRIVEIIGECGPVPVDPVKESNTHTPDVERMIVAGQLYVGIIGSHSDKTLFNW